MPGLAILKRFAARVSTANYQILGMSGYEVVLRAVRKA
jgi:hypothetical protein